MTEDTISQIATPHGAGGIGIIRVSGEDALGVARAARSVTSRPIRRAMDTSSRRTAR